VIDSSAHDMTRFKYEESRGTVTSRPTATETQALITEQQVLLSSAAAVALHPPKTRRWSDTVHVVTSAVSSWLASGRATATCLKTNDGKGRGRSAWRK